MARISVEEYRRKSDKAVQDSRLHDSLRGLQHRMGRGALAMYGKLPEGDALRLEGARIRARALESLDVLLETLAGKIRDRGGHVYFAATAEEATAYVCELAKKRGVKKVVKGKSMLTEEIGLNESLESVGVEAVETDLGEYIIQLAGEPPSHIIAPAIHMNREQIGRLFADRLHIDYTDDPPTLTHAARKALREAFLGADMGISGGNMACVETGQLAIVSNEGNIRMATTLPKIHVAMLGMEKVAASLRDHSILLRLLTRGAAAQNISTYVSYIGGPRAEGETDGPEEFHLVIVDNGRSRILADTTFRESLTCIRCGGCLNVCPVYAKIGGHSYGFPYCGPIGAVIAPLMVGVNRSKDLCLGETLCGACKDVCPVNNDLPRMLSELRHMLAYGNETWDAKPVSLAERLGFRFWARAMESRRLYSMLLRLGRMGLGLMPKHGSMLAKLPPPLSGWTRGRDFPRPAKKSFGERWNTLARELGQTSGHADTEEDGA